MFSPQKTQVEICLLQSNLEEIVNELIVHRSAWPEFDVENDLKFRESLNAVQVSRTLSAEIEKLQQENVRLVARRMQLKMQSEDLAKSVEKIRKECCDIENSSNEEDQEIDMLIRKYEDMLRDKTSRLRETSAYFNENDVRAEIEKVNNLTMEQENNYNEILAIVENLNKELDTLTCQLPNDLLKIAGKDELDLKIKTLTEKFDSIKAQLDLKKNVNNTSFPGLRK